MKYKQYHNFEYDNYFEDLQKSGLKYYPWIGKNFSQTKVKTLVVGESVYNWETDEEKRKDAFLALNKYDFARIVAFEHGIELPIPQRKFARNIEGLLLGTKINQPSEHSDFWENICFHELVQRPMDNRKERPSGNDYKIGANILMQIIDKLRIEKCIFLGTEWRKFAELEKEIINKESLHFGFKINNAHPKIIQVQNQQKTKIYFVKHPSSFFSHDKWNEFINSN